MSKYRNPKYWVSPGWRADHYKSDYHRNSYIHEDRYSVKNNYSIFNGVFLIPFAVFGVFVLCILLGVHL